MVKISRHQERIWALQILYSLDLISDYSKEIIEKKISDLKEENLLTDENYYFEDLVFGVADTITEIDEKIEEKAIDWNINRMGYIERNILRISIYEMGNAIPVGVVINEAVEIAKEYVDEKSARFINGILAKV